MKKLFIIPIILTVVSCNSGKLSKAEKEKEYVNIGETYLNSKISSFEVEKRDGLLSVELIKVDSTINLTKKTMFQMDVWQMEQKWFAQLKFANDLGEIDEIDGNLTENTLNEYKKVEDLKKDLDKLQKKLSKLDSINKMGEIVYFNAKFKKDDGSIYKTPVAIAFNNDLTVNANYMDKIFK